jgi:MoxR-like ATPase
MSTGINAINEAVKEASAFTHPLFNELGKVIVGQNYLTERLVIGLLANGHVLLEGVPGLAKTLAVKSLANCMHVKFSRLQFTPDMLPADVIGTQIYNPQSGGFTTRKGPVSPTWCWPTKSTARPPRCKARCWKRCRKSRSPSATRLTSSTSPFLVLATQNPIEQEGTYPLPEAQVDRFMLKLKIGYPSRGRGAPDSGSHGQDFRHPHREPVVEPQQILKAREVINDIYVDDKVKDYIVDLVCATREPEHYKIAVKDFIQLGASPRATIALTLASKAYAFLKGRGYVTPQDVKSIGMDVLRHRVAITYEAEAEEKTSEIVIQKIFDELPVP